MVVFHLRGASPTLGQMIHTLTQTEAAAEAHAHSHTHTGTH